MGHRRAALLLLAKRLECLADLAPLQMSDLGRDPLQRPCDQRKGRHEARVPVARDDLGGDGIGAQAELAADVLLYLWIDGGVGADSAAHPPDRNFLCLMRQPFLRTVQLRDPAHHLEAERDRLGHHAMRAAGHEGAAVADRELGRCLAHRSEIAGDDARRFDQLHRRRRVVQVLARHPHVDVAGLRLAD